MPRGGDEERGQMPRPRDRCVPTLLNQPVNKKVKLRPPHTSRPTKKVFTCRLVCGEFRQVCDKIGACRAISDNARSQNVLSGLVGPCRALSASLRWTKTINRGSRVPQPMRNCHETHVNKRLFQHGGYRLGPKPKRGKSRQKIG